MPLIQKPNYNQIFASQAPEEDKPAVFNNYPLGWGVESRPNNGKPTIKGFNFLQQTSDLKALWILQNGAALPYDATMEYAEGAPVLKDGVIQYKVGSGFKSRGSVTIPTYSRAADGVDPVTGVADDAYFNVRSTSDESYVDEYQNVGGVPTPTGKTYPSRAALNNYSKSVVNVAELRNLRGVKNGDTVRTLGHTEIGLGGGAYTFEAPSSKIDNNGAYVASSVASGVWVLISDLHFENFGVVNDGTDQSAKIQNAINFILENNIQFIEFEKANEYAIATHASFYQRLKGMNQLPSQKTIVKFNGARLRLLTDNQVGIEVVREHIRLENPSFITSKSGCVGIHNGLIVDNYDDTLLRSSQFMQVISPCTEFLDTAIRFKPNGYYGGVGWGSYYHTIYDHNFRSTNIGFDFAECPSGDNSNTRITIIGGTHVGGACTFLCTNVETITAIGFASEFIKTVDSRLPDSKACTIYMPFNPPNSDMVNGYSVFDGTSEAVTRHYNIQGAEVDVFGRYLGEDDTAGQAFIKAKSILATRGIEGSLKAIGRGVDPSVSPALILRRYKDKTPNGGSYCSIGESADGSEVRIDAESDHPDWKNQLSLNFSKLIVPPVLKPRVTSDDIIEFQSKSGANLFQIDFSGGSPTLWGGTEWKVNGFNINPVFDKTTSLGSDAKRFKKLHAENISLYPTESVNPTSVGELNFELTSDTQLTIRVKGSDQIVRSVVLTLS